MGNTFLTPTPLTTTNPHILGGNTGLVGEATQMRWRGRAALLVTTRGQQGGPGWCQPELGIPPGHFPTAARGPRRAKTGSRLGHLLAHPQHHPLFPTPTQAKSPQVKPLTGSRSESCLLVVPLVFFKLKSHDLLM